MSTFHDWVIDNGGEILAITNPHEEARFRAEGQVHVIYTGKKGRSFSSPHAHNIWKCFEKGQARRLSDRPARYSKSKKDVADLLARDGDNCFFCMKPFTKEDPATLEHLVARRHGGPDHMSNYVLAHYKCNTEADTLSVSEKVILRERNIK